MVQMPLSLDMDAALLTWDGLNANVAGGWLKPYHFGRAHNVTLTWQLVLCALALVQTSTSFPLFPPKKLLARIRN